MPHIFAPATLHWAGVGDVAALDCWGTFLERVWDGHRCQRLDTGLLSDLDLHVYGGLAGDGFECRLHHQSIAGGCRHFQYLCLGAPEEAFLAAISFGTLAIPHDLPLVGYNSGAALDEMTKLCFRSANSGSGGPKTAPKRFASFANRTGLKPTRRPDFRSRLSFKSSSNATMSPMFSNNFARVTDLSVSSEPSVKPLGF